MTNDMSAETVKDVRLCAHGNAVCRTCDRYWWHKAIADNLAEIVASGMAGYNAKGIEVRPTDDRMG
jgi:hypothetical protein